MENNQQPQSIPRNPKWGGARRNAGRKKKYGEETRAVTVRVPLSKVELVRRAVRDILESKTLK